MWSPEGRIGSWTSPSKYPLSSTKQRSVLWWQTTIDYKCRHKLVQAARTSPFTLQSLSLSLLLNSKSRLENRPIIQVKGTSNTKLYVSDRVNISTRRIRISILWTLRMRILSCNQYMDHKTLFVDWFLLHFSFWCLLVKRFKPR